MLYGEAGGEEERLAFLDKVFGMGCTFWDTAGRFVPSLTDLGGWVRWNARLLTDAINGRGVWR